MLSRTCVLRNPTDFFCFVFRLAVFVAAHGLSLLVVTVEYSLVVTHGLLIAVASLAAEHRLWGVWVSARGSAQCVGFS